MASILRALFSEPHVPPSVQTQVCLRPLSAFERLPSELLLQITKFVDISDAVCLTICSRVLNQKLSSSLWTSLKLNSDFKEQRQDFLCRLAQDYPRYIYCYLCCRLHIGSRIHPPGPDIRRGHLLKCVTYGPTSHLSKYLFQTHEGFSLYSLTFSHVQLALLRHRYGNDYGLPLDALSIVEIQYRHNHDIMTLLSVEPAIIDENLHLRVQQWVVYPPGEVARIAEYRRLNVCAHIDACSLTALPNLIRCRLLHTERPLQVCRTCEPLLKCTVCGIEFQMTIEDLAGRGTAVVVSKWLNFGSGKSPKESGWAMKFGFYMGSQVPIEGVREARGLSQRFEEASHKPLKTLTEEHAQLLEGETYVQSFAVWTRQDPRCMIWTHQVHQYAPGRAVLASLTLFNETFDLVRISG